MRRVLSLFRKPKPPVLVNVHVDASAIDVRQLTERIRAELLRKQRRDGGSGIA